MNRSLKLSMLVALALGSAQALAMNLGQIQVKSRLDAPLVAEIPLILSYPGEADGMQVALASAEDFSRAGINRSELKVPLQFAVVTLAQGEKVIRVTSSEPVREPYLDFLVQVNWSQGKLLREYTVLLDPAGGTMAAAPTSQAPTQTAAPAATRPAAPAPQAAATATPRVQDGSYRVQSGDTLSEIAMETRAAGVSYQQMLLALKAGNPDAFFRDNINALKSGAVLRIPTSAEAQALSRADAIAEVRRQNEDWQGAAAASPTMVASTGGDAGSGGASAQASSGAGDRLALVPPSEGGSAAARAGVAGGDGDTTVASLRQQLARSKEALSSQQQQTDELQARVKDLEAISDKNKRLLGLKDAEIAELQQKLAEARKLAGMPAAAGTATGQAADRLAAAASAPASAASAATVAAAGAASVPVPASTAASSLATASTAGPAAAASVAASLPAAPAKPAATAPAKNQPPAAATPAAPAMPWYRQTWAMAAGVVVLLGLLLLMFTRRRHKAPEAARPSLADQFGDSPLGATAAGAADAGIAAMDSDQSELLSQLAEHPDDIGLHLELASLYYARRDVEHFEGAAEAMYAHVSDPEQPEWQDVRAMGEDLAPGHPLFAVDSAGAAPSVHDEGAEEGVEEREAMQDFDLDAYASGPDAGNTEPVPPPAPHASGYSFDFDLTPPRADPAPAPATEPPAMEEFDALPPLPVEDDHVPAASDDYAPPADDDATVIRPHVDVPVDASGDDATVVRAGAGFGDDAVDTKLDLARAYLDMGDPEGARAMLEEVLDEGSQMQKDVAQKLLDEM